MHELNDRSLLQCFVHYVHMTDSDILECYKVDWSIGLCIVDCAKVNVVDLFGNDCYCPSLNLITLVK